MMGMAKLLFRTQHGSHLYGLAHAGSDMDWYEVWDDLGSRRAKQTIEGKDDTLRISMPEFMRQVGVGVPQALEALFAPGDAVELDRIRWLRQALVPGTAATAIRYRRTVKSFTLSGEPKRVRHAARLEHDLGMFLATGRIFPRSFSQTPLADPALYGLPA